MANVPIKPTYHHPVAYSIHLLLRCVVLLLVGIIPCVHSSYVITITGGETLCHTIVLPKGATIVRYEIRIRRSSSFILRAVRQRGTYFSAFDWGLFRDNDVPVICAHRFDSLHVVAVLWGSQTSAGIMIFWMMM